MIDEILKYNKEFVEEKKYEQYKTSKYPDKKIAIITCMDTKVDRTFAGSPWNQEWRCEDHQECWWGSKSCLRKCGTKCFSRNL